MAAVIYARFSTDRQAETSIEDQARICRARAKALHLDVARTFADQAISGSTPVAQRVGGRALLAAAIAGEFSALILEGLDRLSRDQVEQERIVRRLEHRGIRIVGVSDGYDSEAGARKLIRGVRGLVNEIYLDDLREKTHRGLAGQVQRGFHAGGLSYGYRSVAVDGGHRLEIDRERADVVRWIFARYAEGWSCQRLAQDLNARHVRGPRGGTWSVSALYGSPAKGTGVLNNELYVGRYVWNRSKWTKDPDTGKRTRFTRPRAEWQIEQRDDLRILDDDAWYAARGRMKTPFKEGGRAGPGRAPSTLFGGILRCGLCGGSMVKINARDYGCAAHKDRGPAVCSGLAARFTEVDRTLTDHLRAVLSSPVTIDRIEAMVRGIVAERQRSGGDDAIASRCRALEREITRLVEAIAQAGSSRALVERLVRAEAELEALRRATARHKTQLHPSSIGPGLRARLADLSAALRLDIVEARTAVREAFGAVRLLPEDLVPREHRLDVVGDDLRDVAHQGTQVHVYAEFENTAERLALAIGGAKTNLVAGGCNRTRLQIQTPHRRRDQ
jgi:DNA invertase Pin-like site-specific DNA recombinase